MAYKQTAAIERAKARVGDAYPAGWCQKWVVTDIFASGGVGDFDGDRAADAEDGWKAAKKKVAVTSANASSIPAGYPLYFLGGRNDHGHAAVSAGKGQMYSTDLNAGKTRYGRIGLTPIRTAEIAWGVRLAGYVITDGNGNTFTDDPVKAAPVSKPIKPWFNVAFLNTWGNDNEKGARTIGTRLTTMVRDATAGLPAVVGFCEVRSGDQERHLTAAMSREGYRRASYSHMLALYVREHVTIRGVSFAKYKKQRGGTVEGILRAKLTIKGAKCQVGITHLDAYATEAARRSNLKEAYRAMRRFGLATLLPDWKSRTVIMGDFNSPNVVGVLKPLGFKDAGAGAHLDFIAVGAKRKMRGASRTRTTSDHPVVKAKLGRA